MIAQNELRYGNLVKCYKTTFRVGIIEEYFVEPIGRNEGSFPFEELEPIELSSDILIKAGFEKIPHFTVTDSHVLKLGRNRHLSIGCAGTPNEILWLYTTDEKIETKITDIICIHNYDYDGKLYLHKLQNIAKDLGAELHINI